MLLIDNNGQTVPDFTAQACAQSRHDLRKSGSSQKFALWDRFLCIRSGGLACLRKS